MESHRIHLRGPWDYQWCGNTSGDSAMIQPAGTVTIPQEWRNLFGTTRGNVQFRRKFHRPTNLEPHESVMIIFTELRGQGQVQLNDFPVGQFSAKGESVEFDITEQLKPFNVLMIEIGFDPASSLGLEGGIIGVVAIEIRTTKSN